jgi:hypothetical protein
MVQAITDIPKLTNKSTDELFLELGEFSGQGAGLRNPGRQARQILNRLLEITRDHICGNKTVRLLYEEHADELTLASAVFDALSTPLLSLDPTIPIATVSVLTCRIGVHDLCLKKWNSRITNQT